MSERTLAEMTWRQVQDAVRAGNTTLIIPLGATEQHGPHLPLCVDSSVIEATAHRLAELIGTAIVAPVVPIGCSRHHLGFPGTLSIRPETLVAYLGDVCASAAATGFRTAYLVTGHGGNLRPVADALDALRMQVPSLRILAYAGAEDFMQIFHATAARQGVSPLVAGRHSGESETSMMLVLRPELVHQECAELGYMGDPMEGRKVVQSVGIHYLSGNGVLGDPTQANVERGHVYLEEFAQALLRFYAAELAKSTAVAEPGAG